VRSNCLAVVTVLLAGGADPLRLDSHGWTPRALAADCAQRRPGAVHATAFRTIDAVLARAEAGVPLVWSRAAHHKYPASFKAQTRVLLRAMSAPMRRFDVRGLVSEVIADEVIRASASRAWPELSDAVWNSVARTRAAAESRWLTSGGGGGAGDGDVGGGGYRRATQMALGWFGGAGFALHTGVATVPVGASGGSSELSGFQCRKSNKVRKRFEESTSDEDETEDDDEVQSAPPPSCQHQRTQQRHDEQQQHHEQQQQLELQQQQQQQLAMNCFLYQQQQLHLQQLQQHVTSMAALQ